MAVDAEVSLHTPDPQHPVNGDAIVEGVADDVLSAQPADDTHDLAERERGDLDSGHASDSITGRDAAATPAIVASVRTGYVTDDRDYSGASTLERDTGEVERGAPPSDDATSGDGSPESVVADALDHHDCHTDTSAPPDDASAADAPAADDDASSTVDDASASG